MAGGEPVLLTTGSGEDYLAYVGYFRSAGWSVVRAAEGTDAYCLPRDLAQRRLRDGYFTWINLGN